MDEMNSDWFPPYVDPAGAPTQEELQTIDSQELAQYLIEEMVVSLERMAHGITPEWRQEGRSRFCAYSNVVERFGLTDQVKPFTMAKAKELGLS